MGWLAAGMLAVAAPADARFWPPKADPDAAPAARPRTDPAPHADRSGDPVSLRVRDRGGHYEVVAENGAPGPMQVELSLVRAENVRAVPALPASAVVPASATRVLAHLYRLDPRLPAGFETGLVQLPGDPRARPSDHPYRLPFERARVRVDQGFGGRASHADGENLYAVDFALPEGTEVLAARGGVVMQAVAGFDRAGTDRRRYDGRANYVRILHDDGSMAVYAHLEPHGARVRVGEQVREGQAIGVSGNTGYSTGPHLHFVVQVNRGLRLQAIPFRMFSPAGELKFAREAGLASP